MTTPYDVPAPKFIEKLAKYLKENVDEVHPLHGQIFGEGDEVMLVIELAVAAHAHHAVVIPPRGGVIV